jgi:hypothetical protein
LGGSVIFDVRAPVRFVEKNTAPLYPLWRRARSRAPEPTGAWTEVRVKDIEMAALAADVRCSLVRP